MNQLLTLLLTISVCTAFAQDHEYREFYDNGNIKFEYSGEQDAPEGVVRIYYETGELQGELMWATRNDYLHGFCIHYDEEGKKTKEGEYNMGQPVGIWREYNEIGVTQKTYED